MTKIIEVKKVSENIVLLTMSNKEINNNVRIIEIEKGKAQRFINTIICINCNYFTFLVTN